MISNIASIVWTSSEAQLEKYNITTQNSVHSFAVLPGIVRQGTTERYVNRAPNMVNSTHNILFGGIYIFSPVSISQSLRRHPIAPLLLLVVVCNGESIGGED